MSDSTTSSTSGYFGDFGGAYVPEVLLPAIEETQKVWDEVKNDDAFWAEYLHYAKIFIGRPSPLYFAENLTKKIGGGKIYVKREDLNHTGAHKINNALGQALLVKRMGKTRIITETGAGQNGVAVATVCAKFGFDCTVYMGEEDIARQRPNVFWMENLGAKVIPVTSGTKTLKDAVNEALRDWITNVNDTHYMIGSALGAAPFPEMVKEFQRIIGREAKSQLRELENNSEILPDKLIACVGGGSNSIGLFADFISDKNVELIGVEAGGDGVETGRHAARFGNETDAKIGIVQGYKSIFLQTPDGQLRETSSISAGLDYAGIGPEHAYLHAIGRVRYTNATDKEAISALKTVMKYEGMIPALESSHAWAEALKQAKTMKKDEILIVNQSGRGDKDIFIVADALADEKWFTFLKKKASVYFGK
ncbi:TPA: tryptophan synthase subunit beta [Candidatus Gracilibacteria bacterium]|nr:tryptophan synthase subunit beta [Candidatus Peregrinibacteria bacterium]HIQ56638.1 tryptophan synthase subunit beta [Candidatus Gracilibacteria bacterium]HIQ57269.1 tryptophan synthase subunit beta [Candidatus Gracilibacteria bacterium]